MKSIASKIALGLSCLVLVALAAGFGAYVGQRTANIDNQQVEPLVLRADSAARGESLSMATGFVDRGRALEGLFVLDHLSGLLQCWLINPRNGQIAGIYSANVNEAMGIQKGGDVDYVMTTGNFDFEGGQNGNSRPADCICYVGDGDSGKVVGFSLEYNRQVIPQGRQQQGELIVVATGRAREAGLKRD